MTVNIVLTWFRLMYTAMFMAVIWREIVGIMYKNYLGWVVWYINMVVDSFVIWCLQLSSCRVKGLLMIDWFTLKTKQNYNHINLFSYLYSSNLTFPDISFQPLSIYVNSLVKKTTITSHTHSAAQHTIMIRQWYCLWIPGLKEDHHI